MNVVTLTAAFYTVIADVFLLRFSWQDSHGEWRKYTRDGLSEFTGL